MVYITEEKLFLMSIFIRHPTISNKKILIKVDNVYNNKQAKDIFRN